MLFAVARILLKKISLAHERAEELNGDRFRSDLADVGHEGGALRAGFPKNDDFGMTAEIFFELDILTSSISDAPAVWTE